LIILFALEGEVWWGWWGKLSAQRVCLSRADGVWGFLHGGRNFAS